MTTHYRRVGHTVKDRDLNSDVEDIRNIDNNETQTAQKL